MEEFFGSEGKLLQCMNKIGQMIILNIMFLIGCLPIITIGTSLTAFYYSMIKSIRREHGYPVREFWSAYKRNLKKGMIMTILIAAWTALLIFNREYTAAQNKPSSILLIIIYDGLLVMTMLWTVCLFPVMSRFSLRIKELMQMTLVMMIRYLPYAFLIGAMISLTFALWFWVLPIPLILVLPAAVCYAATCLAEPMLLRFMPQPKENEDAWYYETGESKPNLHGTVNQLKGDRR